MVGTRIVSLLVVGAITATMIVSGPLVPLDLTTYDDPCQNGEFSTQGSATFGSVSIPDSATISESEFGADVYRLNVPDANVRTTDVQGCVRLTYEIRVETLNVSSFSVATVHDGSPETISLSLPQMSYSPDRVTADSYEAELRLVYHGEADGTPVERTLASRNVTVEVSA